MSKESLVSTSLQGASYLILLQVGARALTFTVNQILLRHLSPELLGVSTQLELYQISTLYFARESLRVALQRQTDHTKERQDGSRAAKAGSKKTPGGAVKADSSADRAQTMVNLSYLSILLGIPLSLGLAKLYFRSAAPAALETPWFKQSLSLYVVAALWELFTEPFFIVVQHRMLYRVRAGAEAAATAAKCFTTCAFALLAARKGKDVGVLPFAFGQLCYSLVLLAVYYSKVWSVASSDGFSIFPKPLLSRYDVLARASLQIELRLHSGISRHMSCPTSLDHYCPSVPACLFSPP